MSEEAAPQDTELAQTAGALAHEIKNPLSIIRMNVELLAEDLAEIQDPVSRRALLKIGAVQDQCVRLETLLNDFLRFAGLRHLDLKPGNLNEQLERVLDLFEPQAVQAGVDVVRYLDADLPTILLDAQTLHAALLNLIKNSLEAMPDGGQLVVRTRSTRNSVAADIIDTGVGMDQTTAINMFKAFYTTKEGGSGLGLPTTKRIIEAHGARIHVQSEVGRGTQFTLEFPMPMRIGAEDE